MSEACWIVIIIASLGAAIPNEIRSNCDNVPIITRRPRQSAPTPLPHVRSILDEARNRSCLNELRRMNGILVSLKNNVSNNSTRSIQLTQAAHLGGSVKGIINVKPKTLDRDGQGVEFMVPDLSNVTKITSAELKVKIKGHEKSGDPGRKVKLKLYARTLNSSPTQDSAQKASQSIGTMTDPKSNPGTLMMEDQYPPIPSGADEHDSQQNFTLISEIITVAGKSKWESIPLSTWYVQDVVSRKVKTLNFIIDCDQCEGVGKKKKKKKKRDEKMRKKKEEEGDDEENDDGGQMMMDEGRETKKWSDETSDVVDNVHRTVKVFMDSGGAGDKSDKRHKLPKSSLSPTHKKRNISNSISGRDRQPRSPKRHPRRESHVPQLIIYTKI